MSNKSRVKCQNDELLNEDASVIISCAASGYMTRDLTVLSRDFAVKTKSDFRASRRPKNKNH